MELLKKFIQRDEESEEADGLKEWNTSRLRGPDDVVRVRQAARAWASELKFSLVDQTKLVTATSELARNTLEHGGGGTMKA